MGKGTIICVDDERIVLNGLQTQLGRYFGSDFSIELAESGEEALELVNELMLEGNEIVVVISDQLMPGIKGHELLKQIHQLTPSTYNILLTGQTDIDAVTEAVNHANLYRYISKPWEGNDLILTIKEAIKGFYQEKQLQEQNRLLERHNKELEILVDERTKELRLEKEKSDELLVSQQEAFKQLKEAQSQIVQSEKMASLGQLTAGVAHEINNPINFVLSNVNPLTRDIDDMIEFINQEPSKVSEDLKYSITESRQLLEGITDGAKRIAEIVSGLRSFSRLSETEKKKVNLNDGINSCLLLVGNHLKEKNIEVELALGNIPELACYPGELNQAFLNLINNAFDAIDEKGKINISTSAENNQIKIMVKDNGRGMNAAIQQKIFDPFFTTKDVGKGTGLGLSVAFGIIKNHGGNIEVISEQNMGSEFIVKLPYL